MKPTEKTTADPSGAVPGNERARANGKKPYEKPAFVREQLFETMALACGKTNPSIGQCKAVRKSS
ncbi:MAG TPA: hypothetical protein VGY48_22905 [Vicinamibacterales bacterium]|jgi:hypothetical protein|nr:hypothetical protein [Vicinamibacterales bacterium]